MQAIELTRKIREEALAFGFSAIGFARTGELPDDAERLRQWLGNRMHGEMTYLKNHASLRTDPSMLLPGAKTVVSLLHNYYFDMPKTATSGYKIAKYAYGKDYHTVLRKKLKKLMTIVLRDAPDIRYRICIDSAPIMEKAWAMRSGLGWIGKNGCLISKKIGSFVFLSEILLDVELEYSKPATDHCGTCRKCLDACPTDAFVQPYVIDARKCISYLTIELKGELPRELKGTYQDWIFGCDICQDVCPHNRFAKPHTEPKFGPNEKLLQMTKEDWQSLSPEDFENLFVGTPFKRVGYDRLMRNIRFLDDDKQ